MEYFSIKCTLLVPFFFNNYFPNLKAERDLAEKYMIEGIVIFQKIQMYYITRVCSSDNFRRTYIFLQVELNNLGVN